MNKTFVFVVAAIATLGLSGCITTSSSSNQDVSATTGPMLGDMASTTTTTSTTSSSHTTGSSVLGGPIGKSMDNIDQLKLNQALESNRTNQTTSWSNPDNQNSYAVTPTRTFTGASGEPCRDFTTAATVNGSRQTIYGTACRSSSGKWCIISS